MTTTTMAAREVSRPVFIALIASLMALNALAIDVMLPALPYMGEALGIANENERQFVISAYMVGFGFAQLFYGPISDRFGRRVPIFVGLSIYTVAALAAVFAPNFATLLVIRVIQGIGAASTRVIATSIVRDKYSGRAMAEVMSLVFMVFMIIPIIAPGIGQVILLQAPWQGIFIFMAVLSAIVITTTYFLLPETLATGNRRPLTIGAVFDGFRIVFTNRVAFMYGAAGMLTFGALFGFISTSQQIFVDIYGFGPYFPVAFAVMASFMSISSFLNSRIVSRFGMRRISHFALLVYTSLAGIWVVASLFGPMPFWLFFILLTTVMFMFGWAGSNMNSLSMEPLGAVAGTASSVFGFLQTIGGAAIGSFIGQHFDGTVTPVALGYFSMGALALICVLIAERGQLFGVGAEYSHTDFSHHEAH
ncbi:MFS family multidrug efflux protein, similarity to bicyclomycin resistance protein Bcr [Devosia sp. H5989]|uniref:Bcr/CflA family efflux transporter n=1 Tax=Paradevosia tibetensis TaxID=1447062 RepID=A0A5B9DQJ5_9HYPH|nr:multidrug effflux MFS transporter [Youhaiella tibetensis]AKR56152.1 MFS family multidrug efflux protein, similarity to bicyclomycin resistance protein Bcr [Devosia sp. H5989]QEE21205.1 multidrug effflux MFS transporter [Youhaiella tibetensis]